MEGLPPARAECIVARFEQRPPRIGPENPPWHHQLQRSHVLQQKGPLDMKLGLHAIGYLALRHKSYSTAAQFRCPACPVESLPPLLVRKPQIQTDIDIAVCAATVAEDLQLHSNIIIIGLDARIATV